MYIPAAAEWFDLTSELLARESAATSLAATPVCLICSPNPVGVLIWVLIHA